MGNKKENAVICFLKDHSTCCTGSLEQPKEHQLEAVAVVQERDGDLTLRW